MAEFVALAALLLAATPVAFSILRGARAVFLTAIVSGVAATLAGFTHIALDVPITIAWLMILAAASTAILAVPALRSRTWANVRWGMTRADLVQLAIVGAVVVVAVACVPAPLGWDTRSIWLFHATWLNAPASVFVDGQTLPALSFSHPNYPILVPAAVAVAWGIVGGAENYVLGVQVVVLLTILVAALGGSLVTERFARSGAPHVTHLAFTAYLTSIFAVASQTLLLGYVDPLQGASVATLVATLITTSPRRPPWGRVVMIGLVGVAAVSVKQEGFWFALAAFAIYLVVTLRDQSVGKYVPVLATVAVYGVWKLLLAWTGSDDTSDASGITDRISELVQPSSTAWQIIGHVLAGPFSGLPLAAVGASVALLVAAGIARRSAPTWWRILLVGLTPIATSGIVILTFALANSRDRIDWWLATSFSRVITTTEMLAWFGILFAVLLISPWRRRPDC